MSEETEREALKLAITEGYWQRTGYRVTWEHIGSLMDAIQAAGFRCLSESEPYFCVRCGERFSSLGDAHYPHSAALRRSE